MPVIRKALNYYLLRERERERGERERERVCGMDGWTRSSNIRRTEWISTHSLSLSISCPIHTTSVYTATDFASSTTADTHFKEKGEGGGREFQLPAQRTMKFSKILSNLIEQTLPDWRDQFLSYKDLKKQLKLIYPKETTNGGVRSNKRPRLSVDGRGVAEEREEAVVVTKEVIDFVRLLEDEIDKFNAFFVDKEEEYIIRSKVLQDRVTEVQDSNEDLMTVGKEIVDFHGEMVLLLNYSALNYTGLVKILKKYDKRSGALIRLPFIQKVLQQPFFTTDVLNKLVKDCETILDRFFSTNEQLASSYQATEGKEEHTKTLTNAEKGGSVQKVPEELAEIKYIESMYMKHTLTALEVLNKVRGGSSTVSMFSLPPMQSKESGAEWKKVPVIEQAAK
ncbi:hypothetical protein RHGRI_005511 [Rhododendron griersonianum]|uniref:SPX domain-containing protein n=1 Tax=Rhododendron griersonianum TaxID=479676 RepID=A0AAV6LFF7_9ERIC|nr:hypothetical protein RHGRI_005511 [Rhododendron griersonianum]